ncbi:PREDICTED: beta-galactosidase-1-like protein 2 isoform X2 [Capra hircus]|uniref:beta-galactosidase-1-like protein 2 isoform X2 n=1 Tax=Capra hircus TaxID=9925 RepID=UPI000847A24A|nr:PREDICTED: beta-galactosidase-1-like protein 2 isoform X2 [Capra hircus]
MSLAAEVDLWVILCVGPYVGSDLDLGGLPSWLLEDSHMKLRTTHKGFTAAVNRYFDDLIPRIRGFQALLSRGIKTMLMTADTGQGLLKGHTPTVFATLHMKSIRQETYEQLSSVQGPGPVMMMVYTARSLDGWGSSRNTLDLHMLMASVREMLQLRFSLNFYMFHGGTNFGFIGGAMHFQDYKPDVTSYDYDAVLTEAGDYTAKYTKLRELFGSVAGAPLPIPPDLLPKAAYDPVTPAFYVSLWDALSFLELPVTSELPVNMENLPINGGSGQSFGYTLYETTITVSGVLTALVFLDTYFLGTLDYKRNTIVIPMVQGFTTLRILVENCGRVNYGDSIDQQRKGIIGNVYLNDSPLKKFRIYSLEMDRSFLQRFTADKWKPLTEEPVFPAFFLGALSVSDSPCDTFVKLEGWEKGVVFINNQNLGRYWNVGPQETLYLPGVWLDVGLNKIIVFEEKMAQQIIQFVDTPNLGQHEYVH